MSKILINFRVPPQLKDSFDTVLTSTDYKTSTEFFLDCMQQLVNHGNVQLEQKFKIQQVLIAVRRDLKYIIDPEYIDKKIEQMTVNK